MKFWWMLKNYFNFTKSNQICLDGKWIDLNEAQKKFLKEAPFFRIRRLIAFVFAVIVADTIGAERYGVVINCLCMYFLTVANTLYLDVMAYDWIAKRLIELKDGG